MNMGFGSLRLSRGQTIAVALALGLIAAKMIFLEPFSLGAMGLEVHLAAVLLPTALLFGWYGVGGLTVGCALAHLIVPDSLGLGDVVGAGASVLLATGLAYVYLGDRWSAQKLFVAVWIVAILMSFGFGTYEAILLDTDPLEGIIDVFVNVWVAIAVIGYGLVLLLGRFLTPILGLNTGIWERNVEA